MRALWFSPFLILVLLIGSAGAEAVGQPIMMHFREATPSPELRERLEAFTAKMEEGDTAYFNGLVDFEEFKRRVTQRFAEETAELRSPKFVRRLFAKVRESLGKNLLANVAGGSTWHFVRLRRFEERELALFRIEQEDDSLIFLDFEIGESTENGLRIADWYDYALSRWGSEGIAAGAEFAVKAVETSRQGTGHLKKAIDAFMEACRTRDFPGILAHYRQLPEPLRQHPFASHAFRLAATMVGGESYRQALAGISEEGYSIERSFALVDHYFLEGDYENARRALTDFSTLIGGDAALDDLFASIYQTEGKYLESVLSCEKAIRKDPFYEEAYLTLVSTFVLSGNYGDAVLVLDVLENRFRYDFAREHFEEVEELKDFARSRELTEWLARKLSPTAAENPGRPDQEGL